MLISVVDDGHLNDRHASVGGLRFTIVARSLDTSIALPDQRMLQFLFEKQLLALALGVLCLNAFGLIYILRSQWQLFFYTLRIETYV